MKTNTLVKSLVSFLLLVVIFTPVLAFAQFTIPTPTSKGTSVQAIMKSAAEMVWYIFAGISIIMFLVAGILFLTANGSPEKIGLARQAVIWGVVGVVVGLLAGGIINFVSGGFT